MGETLTKDLRKNRTAPLVAGGLLVCASVFVPPAAHADDSLWGKAMNAVGLGGNGAPGQDGASAPQPAPASPQAAPAPAAPKPAQSAQKPPAGQPAQPKPVAASDTAATVGVQAVAPAENQNLLSNWFGLGRGGESAGQGAAAPQASGGPQQKAINPVSAPASPPPAPAHSASMWDNMLGSVGLGGSNPTENVNYNERPKLTVPKERGLPQPNPGADPAATRSANSDALVKPPGDYLEKVKGADGNVSGLRDSDLSKDKKLFGLFSLGQDDGTSAYHGTGISRAH